MSSPRPSSSQSSFIQSSQSSFIRSSRDVGSSPQPSLEVHCSKDFITQFEKALQFQPRSSDASSSSGLSPGFRKSRSEFRTTDSGSVGKRRKKRQQRRVRKAFALRPSKFQPVASAGSASTTTDSSTLEKASEHFSFENCSKELESIIIKRSRLPAAIRPRSSSLPNNSAAAAEIVTSSTTPVTSRKSENACKACRQNKASDVAATAAAAAAFSLKKVRRSHAHHRQATPKSKPSNTSNNEGAVLHSGGGVSFQQPAHHSTKLKRKQQATCAQQARQDPVSQDIDRLTDYLEESILLPKKMSYMAEMMYT